MCVSIIRPKTDPCRRPGRVFKKSLKADIACTESLILLKFIACFQSLTLKQIKVSCFVQTLQT